MQIKDILYEIDAKQIFVPAFQREYVWRRDDAKSLIDSLIRGYPTGTMLTWKTSNPPELKRHKYDEAQGDVKLILDGQQRITTLYMLIRGEIPPYYEKPEIEHDVRGLYVNVHDLSLSYYQQVQMRDDPYWIEITDIFTKKIRESTLFRKLRAQGIELGIEAEDRITDNFHKIERILDQEFPEQIVPGSATIRDAIDIFYKVNASGITLTDAELALAQISGYWPQARETFKKKLAQLNASGVILKLDFVVYALLGCLYHASQSKDLQRLHDASNSEKIRQVWKALSDNILDYVTNFLRDRAYVDHTDEINSIYALIPIIVFFYDNQGRIIPEDQLKRIVKWFYYSQIRSRYVGQMQQKLHSDLQKIQESPRPFEELLAVIAEEERDLKIVPSEFVGRRITHPLFGLMRWYFKSLDAKCFTTGVSIRGYKIGKKYQLEYDHIFPSARLRDAGYTRENRLKHSLAQELTNRVILTQVANRRKSACSAKEYLTEVRERSPEMLEKQSIPLDEYLWKIDHYESFLQARRELLTKQLNRFLEEITAPEEEVAGAMTLAELVANGESEELEFKSSLRWDYQKGGTNKTLETVVAKTVAAFANSDGGTLLVGISDDGTPRGLENDYASLSGDKDKFERHLRGIISSQYGNTFAASNIKVSFPVIDDVEICQTDVTRLKKPLWTVVRDKYGQTQKKFYIRSGNSSQELTGDDLTDYIRQRF